MTPRLRVLWPAAEDDVSPPADLGNIDAVLAAMPPEGRFVLESRDRTGRAEHYLQVERSPTNADYWRIEVRLGSADEHMVTAANDLTQAFSIIRHWLRDENTLPLAPRWWHYRGGNAFADRLYDLTAYIASPEPEPLWHLKPWQTLAPVLGPLLQTGRGRASVRSLQLEPADGSDRGRPIKFGPLAWGPRSDQKWTHEKPDSRRFLHTEVFAPAWPTSHRQGVAPDLIFRLTGSRDDDHRFNVLVATATDMPHPDIQHLHDALRSLVQPVLVAIKQRPFGFGMGHAYAQPLTDYDPVGTVRATSIAELREDDLLEVGIRPERWRLPR